MKPSVAVRFDVRGVVPGAIPEMVRNISGVLWLVRK
jgi:hypothetical protein